MIPIAFAKGLHRHLAPLHHHLSVFQAAKYLIRDNT
jgi:hypothetical protein